MPGSPYRVILIVDRAYRSRVRTRSLAALVRRVLASEQAAPNGVSVVLTSDARVRALNLRFRSADATTDVLSFNLDGDPRFADAGQALLGEIVISVPTAGRQARAAGHSIDDELAHLLAHGVLHLLGYDHQRPRDAKTMRAREEALLGRAVH
jgi:rRNA maturation RNase YbeY